MQSEADQVRKTIDQCDRDFEKHFAAGNAAALVSSYFVPDVGGPPMASAPGSQPPIKGQKALVEMFQGQIGEVSAIRLETLHFETAGDIAYVLGLAYLTLRAGPTVTGRYTVLWKKWQGKWGAQIDFFAADGWQP